jgi:hypothetical protein
VRRFGCESGTDLAADVTVGWFLEVGGHILE